MILSCLITHNRLDLTKMTVESYLNNTKVPHYLVVVDNKSVDGTKEYLESIQEIDYLILSDINHYPGKACNIGWQMGLSFYPEANFIHRSDNDIFYLPYWDEYVLDVMQAMPTLGQLGILNINDQFYPGRVPTNEHVENGYVVNRHFPNVGGNHVTRKILWDLGVRHVENTWKEGAAGNEDEIFSHEVGKHGYFFAHSIYPLATHLGLFKGNYANRRYREYYRRTYLERLGQDIYPDIAPEGKEF